MTGSAPFEPGEHGFARLAGNPVAPDLPAYELRNHDAVTGEVDPMRLNVYLTRDRDYVTIWSGFVDMLSAAVKIDEAVGRMGVATPPGLDAAALVDSYEEILFRGWIGDAETARHVLGALRLGPTGRRGRPQVLIVSEGTFECRLLGPEAGGPS